MSITGQVLIRCDVCKENNIIGNPGEEPSALRKRVGLMLGWKLQRGPVSATEDGTAMLDICPSCEKPKRLTRVK